MAALVHQREIVTTADDSTESLWSETGAAMLVLTGDSEALCRALHQLAIDARWRQRIALAGKRLYDERFALNLT